MKLSEYAGDIDISPSTAVTFVQTWFKPTDQVCVVGRRSIKTGSLDVVSQTMEARELVESLNHRLMESLIFDPDGSSYNLYIGVCPVREELGLYRRGTKDNVAYSPGVWADIDVKPEGFASESDILSWLTTLPLRPTMICGSGSGGVHAYWRVHWNEEADGALVERWWSYLDEMAGERSIDKLVDLTRILRIPGSVYFPKPTAAEPFKLGTVKLIEVSGITYSVEEIAKISKDAYERRVAKRRRIIDGDAQRRLDVDGIAKGLLKGPGMGRWALMRAIAHVEDLVNESYSWSEILSPHGWTHTKTLRDGSNEWARPGQNDRSAVVDFEGSPVMSLLSTSEDTGLSDLLDSHIPLTRYRVLLRLHYQDNEEKLVGDVIRRMNESNA